MTALVKVCVKKSLVAFFLLINIYTWWFGLIKTEEIHAELIRNELTSFSTLMEFAIDQSLFVLVKVSYRIRSCYMVLKWVYAFYHQTIVCYQQAVLFGTDHFTKHTKSEYGQAKSRAKAFKEEFIWAWACTIFCSRYCLIGLKNYCQLLDSMWICLMEFVIWRNVPIRTHCVRFPHKCWSARTNVILIKFSTSTPPILQWLEILYKTLGHSPKQ